MLQARPGLVVSERTKSPSLWQGEKRRNKLPQTLASNFCYSATKDKIAEHGYVLTPGLHVGAEEVEDDGEPFGDKMQRLTAELNEQFAESSKLEAAIRANLERLGFPLET